MLSEPSEIQLTISLLAAIAVPASIYFFLQRRSIGRTLAWKDELASSKQQPQHPSEPKNPVRSSEETVSSDCPPQASSTSEATDAWEERRRRGIPAASSHVKTDAENEKPFGSSYYYAHNNSKAKGGYKDGLKMEDFKMNQPRLLSRGGKAVEEEVVVVSSIESNVAHQSTNTPLDRRSSSAGLKRTLPITRYLWDDPGDATGVATIRIDELPEKQGTIVAWKDVSASITNIAVELIQNDKGLQVKVETSAEADYILRIPMLYGQVIEVEAITKAKRLLVRLKKKKGLFDKSNLKAWPHPQKKIS
jgi:hypothetical protein